MGRGREGRDLCPLVVKLLVRPTTGEEEVEAGVDCDWVARGRSEPDSCKETLDIGSDKGLV